MPRTIAARQVLLAERSSSGDAGARGGRAVRACPLGSGGGGIADAPRADAPRARDDERDLHCRCAVRAIRASRASAPRSTDGGARTRGDEGGRGRRDAGALAAGSTCMAVPSHGRPSGPIWPEPGDPRDYHDANIVFAGEVVAGVLDRDKAGPGNPAEEVVRAIHLSCGLRVDVSSAFVRGCRGHRRMTEQDLDAAARR